MTNIFLTILNMSATATLAAAIILAVRSLIGKKFPKQLAYALWLIILLRLIMPVSFPSPLCVLDIANPHVGQLGTELSQTYFTSDVLPDPWPLQEAADFQTFSGNPDDAAFMGPGEAGPEVNNFMPLKADNSYLSVFAFLWAAGAVSLLTYSLFSYLRLMRRIRTATLLREDELTEQCRSKVKPGWPFCVYVSDQTDVPFLCGAVRPRIILPAFLFGKPGHEDAVRSILLHEMMHIKRFDFILKPLAFFALILHWFNPVVWLCFYLADKDMEMSCDERVIGLIRPDQRISYAHTLLSLAMKQNGLFTGSVLAFGESSVSARIKNIVTYKAPKKTVAAISALLLLLCGVFLLSDPASGGMPAEERINVLFMGGPEAGQDQPFHADTFILADYEPDTGALNIVPIPRDLGIQMDNRTVKLSQYSYVHTPEETLAEINKLLGIQVSRYVKFDTRAFRDLIDAIGGLEFTVPSDMYYDDPVRDLHIALDAGNQILDGSKAEMLVRYRPGNNTTAPMDNQSQVLTALLTRKHSVDIFQNAESLYDLVSAYTQTNIEATELTRYFLAMQNRPPRPETIAVIDFPVSPQQSGLPYLEVDGEQARQLLEGKF